MQMRTTIYPLDAIANDTLRVEPFGRQEIGIRGPWIVPGPRHVKMSRVSTADRPNDSCDHPLQHDMQPSCEQRWGLSTASVFSRPCAARCSITQSPNTHQPNILESLVGRLDGSPCRIWTNCPAPLTWKEHGAISGMSRGCRLRTRPRSSHSRPLDLL